MRALVVASCLALLAFPALAEPWVISGQTSLVANTSVDDPTPADAGAIGQVTELPYVVPAGKVVCIKAYGMEGYDSPGIAVIFVWTGNPATVTPQWRMSHGLPSAAASNGSQEITGLNHCFPEGTYIHVRLINGQAYSGVYGWYVTGEISDAGF